MRSTIFAMILLTSIQMSAQIIGLNGAGFFENRTAQSDEWLHEATDGHEWALRVPGGAIAKFADPTNGTGWGLTYAGIDTILEQYGSNEEEALAGALQKWRRKADVQPAYSYLDELIWLQYEFPGLHVIYVMNIFIPFELQKYPIDYLREAGVNLVMVELGNETYSQLGHNFTGLMERTEQLRSYLDQIGVPYAFPAAPMGNRARPDHVAWNTATQEPSAGHYVNYHRYYDGREYPGAVRPVDTAATLEQILAWDFAGEFQDMKDAFPLAAGYIVTEFNTQPADLIGNTALSATFFEQALPAAKEAFSYFCIHNGVSPDKYGIIFGDPQVRNTSYWPWAANLYTGDGSGSTCDTLIVPERIDTTWIPLLAYDSKCERFWYRLFNWKKCSTRDTIWIPQVVYVPADTLISGCDPVPTERCYSPALDPDRLDCRTGRNDDYLHPERFVNENGDCYCDGCGVQWDHMIDVKFWDRIRQAVYDDSPGHVWMEKEDHIDMVLTLLETGESFSRYDIFHYCTPDGMASIFNTNVEVWNVWGSWLQDHMEGNTHTFGIQLIHRESGLHVNEYWDDQVTGLPHLYVTLNFTGLKD